MKACMVAYTLYEMDNRVRRYAEALAERGDDVDVYVLGKPGQPRQGVLNGVRIHRIQTRVRNEKKPLTYLAKLLLFLLRSSLVLAKKSFRERYDVIHVHSVPDFEVFAALVPKWMGSKIILDIHDIVPEFYASKFRTGRDSLVFKTLVLMEKLSIAFSDHAIIANHLWYETLTSRSVVPGKCTVVMNYPDISIFRRSGRTRDDGKFVTKPLQEIAAVMAEADAGIVPKRAVSFGNEAFSTKIPEFMAVGVPIIASSTMIDRYYFNDSQILFFKSEDVDDLASKMGMLIEDAELRSRLVENGDAYIRENNWDVKRNEYFELIRSL
ncbi:MAG: glycosyl transferase, group 1 [Deltaproteobacteria bacterium]|nr:glycosyl transferase, group 1 [Deltaproteobacteria bacterium]